MRDNEITPSFIVNIPMIRLARIGLNPRNTKKSKVVSKIIIFIYTIQLFMTIFYCSTVKYDSIERQLLDLLATVSFYQVYLRTVKGIQNKNKICEMVDLIDKKFWSKDFLQESKYIEIQKFYKFILLFQTSYSYMTFLACVGLIVKSIVENEFVENFWPVSISKLAHIPPYFEIIWIIQSIYVFGGVYGLLQQDMLFFIFVGVTLIEIIILKHKLASIGTETNDIKDEIITKECIEHHNLLLSILAELEQMYAPILLQSIGSNFTCAVISLFGIVTDVELTTKIYFAGMLMFAGVQFFMYCLLGQFVKDQSSSVAEAAYSCKWEEIKSLNIKRALILCIQRAQRNTNITVGGLMILNLFTFKQAVQMVFSVLTLFLQTKE